MRDAIVLSLSLWCLLFGLIAWFILGEAILGVCLFGSGAVTICGVVVEVLGEMEEE